MAIIPNSMQLLAVDQYKLFMVPSFNGPSFKNEAQERKTSENYSGCNVLWHCEDRTIIEENKHKKTQ